jgi:hypothetical protein
MFSSIVLARPPHAQEQEDIWFASLILRLLDSQLNSIQLRVRPIFLEDERASALTWPAGKGEVTHYGTSTQVLIQSLDVLPNSAARDAAMPNIRVVLHAWCMPCVKACSLKVVTCVKLRHVQQLIGCRIAMTSESSSQGVLRTSCCIVYYAHEAHSCLTSSRRRGRVCPRLLSSCARVRSRLSFVHVLCHNTWCQE